MKNKLTALALATVIALSLAPRPAQASDKGLALVGGLIGGLLIASAINDSHHDACAEYPATVVVNDRCNEYAAVGYWREVSCNVWVPGCWIVERRAYGPSCRRFVEGHYECRNDRVWVSSYDRRGHYDRRDRDDRRENHDRDTRNDYGHRR